MVGSSDQMPPPSTVGRVCRHLSDMAVRLPPSRAFINHCDLAKVGAGSPDRYLIVFRANYDVATFSSSDNGTGSPWSGAIVFTSSFKRRIFRYRLTLFAW